MKVIEITKAEAQSLANHLEFSILKEIRDVGEEYDNMVYLLNLIHVYERCSKVEEGEDQDNDGAE
jgi:hypothetical protein